MAADGVSVLQHLERVLIERDRALALRFESLDRLLAEREKALQMATKALHEKHDQMNRFREETVLDREQYARKEEISIRLDAVTLSIQDRRRETFGLYVAMVLAIIASLWR